ncbi:MAG: ATPase, T2SS/T4P/T4SS family [Betaproteobacteria bacterium]|nr:ATPase, T2SS/T4P/T4SS family [Betaproteobacteria bacterium]
MSLSDLPFVDLSLHANPDQCRVKGADGTMELSPVPRELWPEVHSLYSDLCAKGDQTSFRTEWSGMTLRATRRTTPAGIVFVVRRGNKTVRTLEEMRISPAIIAKLVDPKIRGGAVLFCGPPASRKTTFACATLKARMERLGGFCWTAENPVEYDMQGPHGKGYCCQEEIASDDEILRVMSDTLRSSADMFFIGEIREKAGAEAAVLASASGMFVASTLHAESTQQAIQKMGALVGWAALAQMLKAVITVRLERMGNETVMGLQPLVLDGVDGDGIRAKIRDGNVGLLASDIDKQRFQALNHSS